MARPTILLAGKLGSKLADLEAEGQRFGASNDMRDALAAELRERLSGMVARFRLANGEPYQVSFDLVAGVVDVSIALEQLAETMVSAAAWHVQDPTLIREREEWADRSRPHDQARKKRELAGRIRASVAEDSGKVDADVARALALFSDELDAEAGDLEQARPYRGIGAPRRIPEHAIEAFDRLVAAIHTEWRTLRSPDQAGDAGRRLHAILSPVLGVDCPRPRELADAAWPNGRPRKSPAAIVRAVLAFAYGVTEAAISDAAARESRKR